MPSRPQRGDLGDRQELGLRARGRRVALACARVGDRLRQRVPEVEPVDEDLQDGRDDRRAARRADREVRPALLQDDRRRDRAARALVRLDAVRMRRRVVVEVGQLVVEQEPVAGDEQAGAAGRLDRERVRDDVAVPVRRRDVRRRPGLGRRCRRLAADRDTAVERRRVAGRDGARRRAVGDQVAPRLGEALRQEAAQGHRHEVRVGEVRAAVCERVARRLEEEMERLLARHVREVVALEDVQRLADGRAAARGRAHAEHVEAAVRDVRRRALLRLVRREVRRGHHARAPLVVRGRRDLRVRDRVDDRARERAAVERARPVGGEQLVRLREIRVAEGRADVVGRAVRVEVERGSRRNVVEVIAVLVGLVEERLVDHEAVLGDLDRRRERLRERDRPPVLEGVDPRAQRSGNADGHPAVARVVERQRRAVLPE